MESDLGSPRLVGHLPAEAKPLWLELYISNDVRLIGNLGNCMVLLHPPIIKPKKFQGRGL